MARGDQVGLPTLSPSPSFSSLPPHLRLFLISAIVKCMLSHSHIHNLEHGLHMGSLPFGNITSGSRVADGPSGDVLLTF